MVAFQPLLGVPVFLRTIFTMAEAGYTHFVVVAPAHARRQILKSWQRLAQGRPLHLELVTCRPEHRMTRDTLVALRSVVAPRFLLLDANTLVTSRWIREHLRPALRHGRPLTGPGRILTARELELWGTAIPPEGIRLERLLPASAASSHAGYFPIATRAAWRCAEQFLCEQIRLGASGIVARHLNKRISLPISRVLARLRVHPHVITAFNMCVGLAAGIGTGGMTYWGLLIGALLFQMASVLDGCDGEVAKLTFRTSKFGQYIDTVSDNLALVSFITGLIIHQYRVVGIESAVVWAAILLSGLTVLLGIMIRFLRRHTNSASLVTFEIEYLGRLTRGRTTRLAAFAQHGKTLIKKDCFSLVALGLACLGLLPLWLFAGAIVVWVAVMTLALLRWQQVGRALHTSTVSPASSSMLTGKNARAHS